MLQPTSQVTVTSSGRTVKRRIQKLDDDPDLEVTKPLFFWEWAVLFSNHKPPVLAFCAAAPAIAMAGGNDIPGCPSSPFCDHSFLQTEIKKKKKSSFRSKFKVTVVFCTSHGCEFNISGTLWWNFFKCSTNSHLDPRLKSMWPIQINFKCFKLCWFYRASVLQV